MSNETASGDSNELEALFDSIASGVSAPRPVAFATPQPAPVAAPAPAASLMRQVREGDSLSEDNDDLQALFESFYAGERFVDVLPAGSAPWCCARRSIR